MFKEEIKITEEDKLIIEKLGELLCLTKIDDYFYVGDLEFFAQLKLFTSEFEEAYDCGMSKYFSQKNYYKWVRNNVINKFTGLLEALFKGLLQHFNEDEDGVLSYKNCRAYRTFNLVTQSEEQAESDTHDVTSRILQLNEVQAYENGMLEIEDNLIQTLECFYIKVEQEKVDAIIKKELIKELRVLIYKRMCDLLEANFKRSSCVEAIQYRLMLGILIGVIDKGFTPQFKKEAYENYEVAKNVRVDMKSEFKHFSGVYAKLRHYKKSLIRL